MRRLTRLNAITESAPALCLGLMSGTSADGIDAVIAKISGTGRKLQAQVLVHKHFAFSPALRKRILQAALHGHVAEICELNFELGERFAQAALEIIRVGGLQPRQIAVLGSHGQTLHHLPRARVPSTFQIGEPAVIAERTGILTVANFRARDMAAGGQGAPLVPYADWCLFTADRHPRFVQNIGGIANVTFLPPHARLDRVLAFDTGPGNMVIDAVVNQLSDGRMGFDKNGNWAATGKISKKLLRQLMAHPFLKQKPPKTTGREEFGEQFVKRMFASARRLRLPPADIVGTATAFTAESIAGAYEEFLIPKLTKAETKAMQIILGGGGAKNFTMRRMLAARMPEAQLLTHEDLGLDNSAKEALAFAMLAHQTVIEKPGNVPSATGARRPVVLGCIVPQN